MLTVRTAAWFFSASVVLAGEQLPAESPSPPEDSIAAAKRDLELIKASSAPLAQKRAGLPLFSTPELQVEAPVAAPRSAPKTPADTEALKRAENWLVDAMMKRPAHTTETKSRSPLAAATVTAEASRRPEVDEGAEISARSQPKLGGPEAQERAETVVNPLTNFMAGWMTPQDFKLLQPTWGRDSQGASRARDEFSATPLPATTSSPTERLGPGRLPVEAASSATRENPFLAALGPVGSTAGVPAPPTIAPPLVRSQSSGAVAPPAASTPASTDPTRPSFMKPQDDAKYFKPLKRF